MAQDASLYKKDQYCWFPTSDLVKVSGSHTMKIAWGHPEHEKHPLNWGLPGAHEYNLAERRVNTPEYEAIFMEEGLGYVSFPDASELHKLTGLAPKSQRKRWVR